MKFHVEDINAYENCNGKNTDAKVKVTTKENGLPDISISVSIPLNWDCTLEQTKEALIQEAKQKLQKVVNSF
ncbi:MULTISPECIES: hypothetical protein [Citrobacter]|uniref:hypothetical protein n=1 Tax=Citrobacter TaxID=544 RepID=UPI0004A0F213|nr:MULTISPECIES: hypothetical protein [Citrobacter]ELK7726849.1 hypothetical protein [Citrobacter freundii]KDF19263.1 hypothetical protein AF42_01087 [Citrobacter freundii MGH 56]MBA8129430.1 hypothetical protein [Citrobacter sp. RHBSTW-00013]MDE9687283.1 hypothetical protein [Citrobacter portucalensis]MDU3462136.1 hypothetical protein [Citrobacter sp.]